MTLCALQDVKTFLMITDANSDDVLNALIANVSTLIETYCNRTFAQATYTETRNGGCGAKMFLKNGPVTNVASVTVNGLSVPPAPNALSPGFVWDDSTVYIRSGGYPSEFYKGVQNVTVVYTAGYTATPPDINQACVEWVAFKFAKRKRIDKKSETLGQQQTVGFDTSDMPAGVKTTLQQYTRWTGT